MKAALRTMLRDAADAPALGEKILAMACIIGHT
jgi:hypothetical protein